MNKLIDDRGRGARIARREEGAYSPYATDEQRREPGRIDREGDRVVHLRALTVRAPTVVLAALLVAGCGDTAVVLTIDSDLEVPARLDGLCLSLADRDPAGGEFTRFYPLGPEQEVTELPQTLTVEPGSAAAAIAGLRGYKNGLEVARDRVEFDFPGGIDDADLMLAACRHAGAGTIEVAPMVAAPPDTRVVASYGRGGTLVLGFGVDFAEALVADPDGLGELPGVLPELALTAAPAAVVAFDADGDCDDDVLLLPGDAPPVLLVRDGREFVDGSATLAGASLDPQRAAATADVDGDGDLDLVIGGGNQLRLLRNDGGAEFQVDGSAVPPGVASDVTALALGDVDGDGHVDIVVGQGDADAAPNRLLVNDSSGSGFFASAPAVLPDTPARTRALVLVDVGADGFLDLAVAGLGMPVRLYVNRGDGRLEDRSFVTLPSIESIDATGLAGGYFDGDCFADLVVAQPDLAPLSWRGTDAGALTAESLDQAPAGTQVVLADVDDDGAVDLLIAGGTDGIGLVRR